jgi:hypothetical protein
MVLNNESYDEVSNKDGSLGASNGFYLFKPVFIFGSGPRCRGVKIVGPPHFQAIVCLARAEELRWRGDQLRCMPHFWKGVCWRML